MPDERSLPTKEDLKKLPLRAILAYALRCARRLQLLYLLKWTGPRHEQHRAAIEAVLTLCEQFCRGELIEDDTHLADAVVVIDAAQAASGPILDHSKGMVRGATAIKELYAAHSDDDDFDSPIGALYLAQLVSIGAVFVGYALYAACGAGATLHAVYGAAARITRGARADDAFHAACAGHAVDFADECTEAVRFTRDFDGSAGDYERLLSLDLGTYPDVGRPIDPSESGPLGPFLQPDLTQGGQPDVEDVS